MNATEFTEYVLSHDKTPSPSQLPLLAHCRASFRECAALPNISGEAAIDGRANHRAAELIARGEEPDAVKLAAEFYILPEDAESAISRQWYVRKFIWFGWTMIAERALEIDLGEGIIIRGTLDLALISPDGLEMIVPDQKSGRLDVESPQKNFQLIPYGIGALALPEAAKVQKVTLAIIYSRFGNQDPWETTPEVLMDWKPTLRRIVQDAMGPRANYTPGPHCEYCRASSTCPALHAMLSPTIFSDPMMEGRALAVRFDELTTENQADFLIKAKLGAKICADVIEMAKMVSKKNPIPMGDGKVFGPREESRKNLIPSKESSDALFAQIGPEAYLAAVKFTNEPIEKAIMAAAPKGMKGKSVKAFWESMRANGLVEDKTITKFAVYREGEKGENDGD